MASAWENVQGLQTLKSAIQEEAQPSQSVPTVTPVPPTLQQLVD